MSFEYLGGPGFRAMLVAAADHLEQNKDSVDALNVFPVPDGDTGTNMSLTVRSAVKHMNGVIGDSLSAIAEAVSFGSLMGARGNSGVILSQIFRGLARGMAGKDKVNPSELSWALQEAVDTAYKAVMKPVEGTILTVAREYARAAMHAARAGSDCLGVLRAALEHAERVLERTPEMLPVLKQAGVVDAGGKGFCVLMNGALRALGDPAAVEAAAVKKTPGFKVSEDLGEIKFVYDTQLLIRGRDLPQEVIRGALGEHGDSLLVVGSERVLKVHIHTNTPDRVIGYCLRFGELSEVTIENMKAQYEGLVTAAGERAAENVADPVLPETIPVPEAAEPKEVAVVSVAVGDGLVKILKSLGVDEIIDGGQTMNPSTAEIVEALNRVPAKQVLVLPNNGNIVMAAEQARMLTDKEVCIIPTKSVPQGVAALLAMTPGQDLVANAERMKGAINRVKTGEVTYAVRSTTYQDVTIKEGDIIGITDDAIAAVGADFDEVLAKMVERLVTEDDEVITIFYGSEVDPARAEAVAGRLREAYLDREIEMHYGGQPLYYYLLSVE
ncbi:MAG: DAK2 domain-containing protein [Bacillota bacterium]